MSRGKRKKIDNSTLYLATTNVLNSLPKDKDHIGEGVYTLIIKEYRIMEGMESSGMHLKEYDIRRYAALIKETRLTSLGWRRITVLIKTDVMHKGKLIKQGKNHFRYIGDDE